MKNENQENFEYCKRIAEEIEHAPDLVEWIPDKGCKLVVQDNEGRDIDFYAAVALMDDEIREDLHNQIAPTTPQKFFDAYSVRHLGKYGEPFFVN